MDRYLGFSCAQALDRDILAGLRIRVHLQRIRGALGARWQVLLDQVGSCGHQIVRHNSSGLERHNAVVSFHTEVVVVCSPFPVLVSVRRLHAYKGTEWLLVQASKFTLTFHIPNIDRGGICIAVDTIV